MGNKITRAARIFLAVLCVTLFSAFFSPLEAQQLNHVPLFEGGNKTPQQIAADQKFVKDAVAAAGSKEKAADALIDKGWDALQSGDARTAIHRFNQAYLLAPQDFRVYWGLGAASGAAGNFKTSLDLFKRAAPMAGENQRFTCDYGFSNQQFAIQQIRQKLDPVPYFQEAEKLYTHCKNIDSSKAIGYSHLAVIQYFKNDCAGALSYIAEAKKRGGDGLTQPFLEDVASNCK